MPGAARRRTAWWQCSVLIPVDAVKSGGHWLSVAPQAKRLPESLRQALNMDRAASVRQRPLNLQVGDHSIDTQVCCMP